MTTTITTLLIALAIVLAIEVFLKAIYLRGFNRELVRVDAALDELLSEQEDNNECLAEGEPYDYMLMEDYPNLRFAVYALKQDSQILVKSFHYVEDEEEDREYAMRCAVELLEKLKENTVC